MAAVEFAMLAPVLLLIYFGAVEVTQGVMLNRKTTLTAATVGNIVSQYTTISAGSQLPDILKASSQIFAPFSSTPSSVVVSCINIDSNSKATVAWSQALNTSARAVGQTVVVPTGFVVPNTTVVLSEANYAYTAFFDFLHIGTINMYSPVYMSPRASTTITLTS